MSAAAPLEARQVHVSNVSATSTSASLHDYFAFVGEIESLELEADAQNQKATVTFKRPTAASSAVMLSGGVVDGSALSIKLAGAASSASHAEVTPTTGAAVAQEDKPRAARVAELLAAGYNLSDDIAARAIALDKQHGLSVKFKDYLGTLDKSLGAQLAKHAPASGAGLTDKTEAAPAGAAAQAATTEKDASALPVPGTTEADVGPKTTTEVPVAAAAAAQPKTASEQAQKAVGDLTKTVQAKANEVLSGDLSKTVQAKANEVLSQPQVKTNTDFVWAKLSEYYSAVVNHPRIHSLWTNANQTVADIHAEAKQIAEEKKRGGASGVAGTAAPADLPTPGSAKQSSVPLLFIVLMLLSTLSMPLVKAHIDEHMPPAMVAGEAPHKAGEESYMQKHMASEHHIGAFDLGSFFALHDLDRNGVLDRAEIEAIYGVHHSTSVKHSPSFEVHDAKADRIVAAVLHKIDTDGDGLITKAEFEAAGSDGLPAFSEYGQNVLGHHYDEESEYFVHHEEIYHNTPDTQTDESYSHKEDLEHFAHHNAIEAEEERRERKAEGMPSAEEDAKLKADAEAHGKKYVSPYEQQIPKENSPAAPQLAYDSHREGGFGGAAYEARVDTEHVFKTPEGEHVVKAAGDAALKAQEAATEHEKVPEREVGETDEGYKIRLSAHAQRRVAAENYAKANPQLIMSGQKKPNLSKQQPGESESDYLKRLEKERFEALKKRPNYSPNLAQKQASPNKYPPIAPVGMGGRRKGSYFGEF